MLIVTKTPTPLPWYQPSNQVPFEFTVSSNEAWEVQPIAALHTLSIGADIFTGTITLDGFVFVVNNDYPFTPTTFQSVDGNPVQTLRNLVGAMTSHPSFLRYWTWYITGDSTGAVLTMTAKTAEYAPKAFTIYIDGTGAFNELTGNTEGVMKPNFKLAYQISVIEELHDSLEIPCHPVQLVDTTIGQIVTAEKIKVDFAKVVNAHLGATLITTACDRPVWDFGLGRNFRIRYGTSIKLDNSDIQTYLYDAGTFFIIKQNLDTIAGVEPYVRRNPADSTYKGKALNQFFDTGLPLHQKSVAWAYVYYNGMDYDSITPPKSAKLRIYAMQTDVNGSGYGVHEERELVIDDLNFTRRGVAALPIGFANLGLVRVAAATHVKIDFFIDRTMPDDTVETVNLFSHSYRLSNCFESIECYFLSRTGAFETILFDDVYTVESEVSQQEYKPQRQARNFLPPTNNAGDYLDRQLVGSVSQYNAVANRQYKVTIKARPSKALSDYLESFLTSPKRYMKVKYDSTYGLLYTLPFIISHSTTSIDRSTGLLVFEATLVVDSTDLL